MTPVTTRTAVVLPAPLGPSRTVTSPGLTVSERPSSATTSPNRRVTPTSSITGSPTRHEISGDFGHSGPLEGCRVTSRLPGGVAEWFRQGPAKPRTRVRFPPPPPSVAWVGRDRDPIDTEVTGRRCADLRFVGGSRWRPCWPRRGAAGLGLGTAPSGATAAFNAYGSRALHDVRRRRRASPGLTSVGDCRRRPGAQGEAHVHDREHGRRERDRQDAAASSPRAPPRR